MSLAQVTGSISFGINFVSNLLLVLATWKSKKLRSPCNLLIAFDSLMYIILTFPLNLLTAINANPSSQSFFSCYLVTFSWHYLPLETAGVMPLLIAVERALGVFFPIWSKLRNQMKYAAFMAFLGLSYGSAIVIYYGIRIYLERPNEQVACNYTEVYASSISAAFVTYKNIVVVVVCWVIYIAIWVRIKFMNTLNTSVTQKLSRSLTVIVVLITISWLTPTLVSNVLLIVHTPMDVYVNVYSTAAVVSIYMCSALTFPTLYIFGSEYRNSVNELVAKFLCTNKQQLPVDPQQQPALFIRLAAAKNRVNGALALRQSESGPMGIQLQNLNVQK